MDYEPSQVGVHFQEDGHYLFNSVSGISRVNGDYGTVWACATDCQIQFMEPDRTEVTVVGSASGLGLVPADSEIRILSLLRFDVANTMKHKIQKIEKTLRSRHPNLPNTLKREVFTECSASQL
jgi:hypothetical protein